MIRTAITITALLLAVPADGASAQSLPPLAEAETSSLGYPTVDAAIAALRVKPGVTFATENGWLIATDEAELTVWSFAPRGDPSFPSAVKRQAVAEGAGSRLVMSILCEASKEACDNLARTFARMNGISLDQ